MSWSVSASGNPEEVKTELARQFAGPLAEKPAGITDDGERETIKRISETIAQILETFAPERTVKVVAYGSMAFDNWDTKTGARQTVNLSVQ